MARYARVRNFSKAAIDRLSSTTSTPHADRDLNGSGVMVMHASGGHDDRVEVAENRTVTQYLLW